jgi:hypothetical protein
MIIGISGYKGSGKSTAAAFIMTIMTEYYEKKHKTIHRNGGWQIEMFAGLLKEFAASALSVPVERFEDESFKSSLLPGEWFDPETGEGRTYRWFLQRLGTEAMRNGVHPNFWVNALIGRYRKEMEEGKNPKWVISDVRFENEAEAILDYGGLMIRIERIKDWEQLNIPYEVWVRQQHASEVSLDGWPFDATIDNTGTRQELFEKLKQLLYDFMITD